jgi:hypothetical protein
MTVIGWCVHVAESPTSFALTIRHDRDDTTSSVDHVANELRVFRNGFQRAGEAIDAEELGPLGIEFYDLTAVVSMRETVPDWDAMRPS